MHTYYLYTFSLKNMQHTPFHGNNIFSACNKFTLTYSLTHFSPFIGFLSPDFSYFHTHGCILFQSLSIASPTYLLLPIHKISTLYQLALSLSYCHILHLTSSSHYPYNWEGCTRIQNLYSGFLCQFLLHIGSVTLDNLLNFSVAHWLPL